MSGWTGEDSSPTAGRGDQPEPRFTGTPAHTPCAGVLAVAPGRPRCRRAPNAPAPPPAVPSSPAGAVGATDAATVPTAAGARWPKGVTPACTAPSSAGVCWPHTGCAAVPSPCARTTRPGRARGRPPWPITGRSPAESLCHKGKTRTTRGMAGACVPPVMAVTQPPTPGPREDGTAREKPSQGRSSAAGTDRPPATAAECARPAPPRGGTPQASPGEPAAEGQFCPVRFPRTRFLRRARRVCARWPWPLRRRS